MGKPTPKQKQFLLALGHKNIDGLDVRSASDLINRLVADEKASGKTFACPYCKEPFSPRPRNVKSCPSCGQKIVHIAGTFYTEQQVEGMPRR